MPFHGLRASGATVRLNSLVRPTGPVQRSFRWADGPTESTSKGARPTPGLRSAPLSVGQPTSLVLTGPKLAHSGQPCSSLCHNPGGVVARSCFGLLATSDHPLLDSLRERLVHAATGFLYIARVDLKVRANPSVAGRKGSVMHNQPYCMPR